MAYQVGQVALPDYAHRCSRKTYTLAQLFACLVLKSFFKTDYRGVTRVLEDCSCYRGNTFTFAATFFAEGAQMRALANMPVSL